MVVGAAVGELLRAPMLLPKGYDYRHVLTVEPSGWPVYTQRPVAEAMPDVAGLPCTVGLALKRSDHDYVLYGLDGGP
jgi:hypothetical protein